MTVLVLGASSQIGVFLLPRLVDAGYSVLAVSRKAPAGGQLINPQLNWVRDPAARDIGLDRVTALISCGPLSLVLQWLPNLPTLERCVAFSSSSVHVKQSHEMDELRDTESSVRTVMAERHVPLCLLRPTLIYGCGLDRNISLLAAIGKKTGCIPVSSAAHGLRQPVHADDLANAAVNALTSENPPDLAGEICGGSTLSYRQMAETIASAGPNRVRVISLPPPLFRMLLGLLRGFRRWRSLEPGMVDRQAKNLVFDDHEVRAALGLTPRPFKPEARDFELPARGKQFQLPIS